MSFEEFLEKYGDEVGIFYAESGAMYDTELEVFVEHQYQDFLENRGIWARKKPNQVDMLAKE